MELRVCECGANGVTRVPVVGNEWRCSWCAETYWHAVVRVAAAVAHLERVLAEPAVWSDRPCVRCLTGRVDARRRRGTLCTTCIRDACKIRMRVLRDRRREVAA